MKDPKFSKEDVVALFSGRLAASPNATDVLPYVMWQQFIARLLQCGLVDERAARWKQPVTLNTLKQKALAARLHERYRDELAQLDAPVQPAAPEASSDEEVALSEQLARIAQARQQMTCTYAELSDVNAFLFHALVLQQGKLDATFLGVFYQCDGRGMSPDGSVDFFDQLYEGGNRVIMDDPAASPSGSYIRNEDGEILFAPGKVAYRIVPDCSMGAPMTAFEAHIESRSYGDGKGLYALWLSYAEKECMAYLENEMARSHLQLSPDTWSRVKAAIKLVIETYSISEAWATTWLVLREAEKLALRPYYSAESAAETIPGKILRHYDRAQKGECPLRRWDRPTWRGCGTVGDLFCRLFRFDNHSSGKDVRIFFEQMDMALALENDNIPDEALRHLLDMELQYAREADKVGDFVFNLVKALKETGGRVVSAISILDQARLNANNPAPDLTP